MKKKTVKKKKPTKQKIDVVLESLLNLEQKTKELIKKIDRLESSLKHQPLPQYPKYWPTNPSPFDPIVWW
jgi:hypothetical protein